MAFNFSKKVVKAILTFGVFAYSLFNFFYNLDAESFYTDEVVYSLCGLEYLQGNFTRNLDHPFLGKYLIGLSLRLLGKSDFSARFPCALFGFLAGVVLFFFAKELTNFYFGLVAVSLWSSSPIILWISRRAILDSFLVFFVTLSLYVFWRFFNKGETRYALLGGISLGLALSCKLMAAVVVPILLVYIAFLSIKERRAPKLALLIKLALALLVVLTIFLLVYAPVLGRLGSVLRFMAQFLRWHQQHGHRVVVHGVIYDKPPWWAYLYWYWHGDSPYLQSYSPGLLIMLGMAIYFALLRRDRNDIFLLLSFVLPFSYLSFCLSYKMFRYADIFEPSLIILACSFMYSVSSYFKRQSDRNYVYLVMMSLLVIVIIHSMIFASWHIYIQEENEYKAVANHLRSKVKENEVVFVWGYTDVMEWYLGSGFTIVGGYTTDGLQANYNADYLVIDPRMRTRWPNDPLVAFLEENKAVYEEHTIRGLKLYVKLANKGKN